MEKPKVQLAEEKKGLDADEFGIRQGAEFILSEGSKLQISDDGTVIITYKIKKKKDIISGPKTPEQMRSAGFDAFGAFKTNSKEKLVSGLKQLDLTTNSDKEVIISSEDDGIFAITNGVKRESGVSLLKIDKEQKGD